MKWYQGNIAEAVAMSKTRNAIFVVYIEGKDELTEKLTKFINEPKIKTKLESADFVAVKIASESEAYMQFAKIYQIVPVPSIFFIGTAGTPLEIGTGIIESSSELEQKIEKVLTQSGKASASSSSASLIAAEQSAIEEASTSAPKTCEIEKKDEQIQDTKEISNDTEKDENVEVTNKKEITNKANNASGQDPVKLITENNSKDETVFPSAAKPLGGDEEATGGAELNARLEEKRNLLEQKRRERIETEKKLERDQEIRLRREGKVHQLQPWQKDDELKELKDNLRRDRLEEKVARERIRAQIAGDRAERAQRFSQQTPSAPTPKIQNNNTAQQQHSTDAESIRLQFRLPTGENRPQTFHSADKMSAVRNFVRTELLTGTGIRDFTLATTYPKREFAAEHDEQSLLDLGLFPSAVILVIAKESGVNPARIIARSGGIFNMLTSLFWTLLSPVFAVMGYFKNIGSGGNKGTATVGAAQKRTNTDEQAAAHLDAAKRRNLERFANGPSTSRQTAPEADAHETKPQRRYMGASNIHRLTDKRKDSDDENATWNGNSTQQQ